MRAQRFGTWPFKSLLLACLAIAVLATSSCEESPSNVSNSPTPESNQLSPPTPTLNKLTISARAKQIEAVILRDALVNEAELTGLPLEELHILRNVVFARHGMQYEKPGLGDYFYNCDWYKPDSARTPDSATNWRAILTANDEENKRTILGVEKISKATPTHSATPMPRSSGSWTTPDQSSSGRLKAITEFTPEESGIANELCTTALKKYFGSRAVDWQMVLDPPYVPKGGSRVPIILISVLVPTQNFNEYDTESIKAGLNEEVNKIEVFRGGKRYSLFRSYVRIEFAVIPRSGTSVYGVTIVPYSMRIY